MKVDGSLRSLLQGVSQQPPRDRLPGQCTEQVNMISDPVDGLGRRAPTDLVGSLFGSTAAQYHNFETRAGGKFLLALDHTSTGPKLSVTDYNAEEIPVTIESNAAAYLSTPGEFVFGNVNNLLVMSNTAVTPQMLPDVRSYANVGPGGLASAVIQVLGGNYAREYRITYNGTLVAMYRTVDGAESDDAQFIRPLYITNALVTALTSVIDVEGDRGSATWGNGTFTSANGFTVNSSDDVILIRRTSGTAPLNITGSDDSGGVILKVMTDQVPDTEDLPRIATHGYLARVAQSTDPDEDIYLEFQVEGWSTIGTGFGRKGYWRETVAPNLEYLIDPATMPHVLEYDPEEDSFVFRRGNWRERRVGTDISNPIPSFIDNPIRGIATFQGRLVFIAGSYVCMSRTNREEDFWMGSASQLVESDPVDISSTSTKSSLLEAIVPHNRDLVVSSRSGQFIVPGRQAVTPQNATLQLSTSFEVELSAHPVPAGRNVFFATNYGRFSGIREFFTEGNTEINDTRPVTQHVKKYLVGTAEHMAASSNYDMLLVRTAADDAELYVYQYVWDGADKIQSAWHRWIMPYRVQHMFFDEELVYFVMRTEGGAYLHRMSLDIFDVDDVGYPVYLDNRFDVFDCYTLFTFPPDWVPSGDIVAVQGPGCPNPGLTVPILAIEEVPEGYVAALKYDMQGGQIIVGSSYRSSYKPTMPLVKDENGVVIGTSDLRVKQFLISLDRTGHIVGHAFDPYSSDEPVEFQARTVGAVNNLVGIQPLASEIFQLPFRRKSDVGEIELWTDRHLPMTILDIEWVGQYTKKGRRLNV